jgi:hypothetical protein
MLFTHRKEGKNEKRRLLHAPAKLHGTENKFSAELALVLEGFCLIPRVRTMFYNIFREGLRPSQRVKHASCEKSSLATGRK